MLSSNLHLCFCSGIDTSSRHSALISPRAEASGSLNTKTTAIVVDNLLSNALRESENSIIIRSIAFTDKFVSPHHFEDALYGTSLNTSDMSFDHGIELMNI
jgi:hypothetical protein